MNNATRTTEKVSRKQQKRIANAARAAKNAVALRQGNKVRLYIAPPNSGKLDGNRATRRRRVDGFIAMNTVRSHKPNSNRLLAA